MFRNLRRYAVTAPLLVILGIPAAVMAQTGPPDFEITAQERESVIEGALKNLNDTYVFPETAKRMEQAIRSRTQKGEYRSITSAAELSRKLTEDLREVSRDGHLSVMHFAAGVPDSPSDSPTPEQLEQKREFTQKVNFGFEKVERMQGNVGYLEIRGFVPPALGAETAAAAMNFVAHSDALIIDLRRNGGGDPAMVAFLMGYLFDEPTHLNDIWERVGERTQQWWALPYGPGAHFGGKKPLYVLTSSKTFSGGEEFAYNVKTQKRGVILGETTGGGAHPVRSVKINDRFAIGVPFARAINPITKTNWEGTGVEPHIAMPADDALDAAYWMAIEKIAETTSNPQQKRQLENMLSERTQAVPR